MTASLRRTRPKTRPTIPGLPVLRPAGRLTAGRRLRVGCGLWETAAMDGEATITLAGDAPAVGRLLADEPRLAQARITARGGTRTPLHVVTDWPGYFPEGPQMAGLLIEAGADLDAVTTPDPGETPLHWAASSDDADVAAVLIDGGADLEKPGGSIGTPLDNAIGYSCWHVARLLAARGAR